MYGTQDEEPRTVGKDWAVDVGTPQVTTLRSQEKKSQGHRIC